MTKKEIKAAALLKLWHWGFHVYEGYPNELSDTLHEDVCQGKYNEADAKKVQKELFNECEKIFKRITKLKSIREQTA